LTGLVVALLLAATTGIDAVQSLGVLRVTVAVGGDQAATPVPRHLLLVSDNPASAPPRRLLTAGDGTLDVRLPPGNYTVESDRPVAFQGRAYQWTQMIDVAAGHDTVLALTAANAEISAVTAAAEEMAAPAAGAATVSASRWHDSAVDIWTQTARASGAIVSATGLVVTTHRGLGDAGWVAVQLTPAVKVAASLVVSDPVRNVAVLRIDPATAALLPPVSLGCGPSLPPAAAGQEITALGVRVGEVCEVVAAAEAKMTDPVPAATRLPVEPARPFPAGALKEATVRRTGPLQLSSADFDLAFITPLHVAGSQGRSQVMDFMNWSDYVAERHPVLLIRATPKLVEGFWAKVGRAAAMTQGIALPAFKRPKSGFARLRVFCGEAEVTPIHPFKLEQRLSATDTIFEGLYVFDPDALSPSCGTVKLELYSEKEPNRADIRIIDTEVIRQLWQDFAAYRALK